MALPLDLAGLAEGVLLGSGLSRREGQLRAMRLIARVVEGATPARAAAVEAGTGTGKSFAYLLPAMLSGRRAVVATAKKTLQAQLKDKDAPFVASLVRSFTGRDPSVAVLLGKNNYLCPALLRRRLEELGEAAARKAGPDGRPIRPPELCFLDRVAAWAAAGGSGLRDDLPPWPDAPGTPEDREAWWHRVSAADDDADCRECPDVELCAFRLAREAAARADVVLANHHLVAADFLLRRKAGLTLFAAKDALLPELLILDEAHAFPEAFRSALEASLSAARWHRLKTDILRFTERDLPERLLRMDCGLWTLQYAREKAEAARDHVAKNAGHVEEALEALFSWGVEALRQTGRDRLLLLPGAGYPEGRELLRRVDWFLSVLLSYPERVLESARLHVSEDHPDCRAASRRMDRLRERCSEFLEAVGRTVLLVRHYRLAGEEGDCVEFDGRRFTARPVGVASELRALWGCYSKVILTSATLFPLPLNAGGGEWFDKHYGFAPGEAAKISLPSPFDYARQMEAYVVSDPDLDPDLCGGGEEDAKRRARRIRKLAEIVFRTAGAVPGGTLALFTSYREMRDVAALLAGRVPRDRLLVQGRDGGSAELLERFRSHGRALLLGVASFWEGVDVPGEALSALVIAKIPFPCPDDPLAEAQKWFAGRNWFRKVWVPAAALALRQGVGRLIRTEEDRGVVVVCDPRAAGRHRFLIDACLPVKAKAVAGPAVPDQDVSSEVTEAWGW